MLRLCTNPRSVFDETCLMFRTMRDVGFLLRAQQTAAFCQLLAMSSWHLAQHQGAAGSGPVEHLAYSSSGLRDLQAQINDPEACLKDETITGVLVFICSAVSPCVCFTEGRTLLTAKNLIHDPEMLNVHINGLRLMLRQRGSFHTIDLDPAVRLVLFWYEFATIVNLNERPVDTLIRADINGAYLQDRPPYFDAPHDLLPSPSPLVDLASTTSIIASICSMIHNLQEKISEALIERDVWQDPIFPGLHISPLLRALLSLQIQANESASKQRTTERFRLAAILYVSSLRARFGMDTAFQAPGYAEKLLTVPSSLEDDDDLPTSALQDLLLWCSAIAATSRCLSADLRIRFVPAVVARALATSMDDNDGLTQTLRRLVWSEHHLDVETSRLSQIWHQASVGG